MQDLGHQDIWYLQLGHTNLPTSLLSLGPHISDSHRRCGWRNFLAGAERRKLCNLGSSQKFSRKCSRLFSLLRNFRENFKIFAKLYLFAKMQKCIFAETLQCECWMGECNVGVCCVRVYCILCVCVCSDRSVGNTCRYIAFEIWDKKTRYIGPGITQRCVRA